MVPARAESREPAGKEVSGREPARRWPSIALAWLVLTLGGPALVGAAPALRVWRLEAERVDAGDGAPRGALPVGSLQKPFVAKAWALAHPGAAPPHVMCDHRSGCWRPSGHGLCDLVRALTVSCNTYFRQLAGDTPPGALAETLRAEGFDVAAAPTPAGAVGLPDPDARLAIAPEALLRAYARLATRPWPAGEAVRRLVLQGLRDAARVGTARGLARRGYWAKTGTVPALDGAPLQTSGWALALDDAGTGWLALLPHGTGTQAATALGERLNARGGSEQERRPAAARRSDADVRRRALAEQGGSVRVRLLDLLAPRRASARNAGSAPAALITRPAARSGAAPDWVGDGAVILLEPGLRLGRGSWELRAPEFGFVRRLVGELDVARASGGGLRLIADVPVEEYVQGVVDAEAPRAEPALREELGASVLRLLALGPRHAPEADVCDSTHCAVFGGRGPRLVWLGPRRARVDERGTLPTPFDAAAWERMRGAAREAGPSRFTGHCGGAPLSERYVWGRGDPQAARCPRHAPGSVAAWRRRWPLDALRRAFGAEPADVRVDDADGVWRLEIALPAGRRRLLFDDAHRALAGALGWDALPSPAARVRRTGQGFEAEGVGAGHRVGLCLGGSPEAVLSAPRLD